MYEDILWMFDKITRDVNEWSGSKTFPKHNLVKISGNEYLLQFGVAGYTESEIEVLVENKRLTVKGTPVKKETSDKYLYRGLTHGTFVRTFYLGERMQVTESYLNDGILSVKLHEVVPETEKPKRIEVKKLETQVLHG